MKMFELIIEETSLLLNDRFIYLHVLFFCNLQGSLSIHPVELADDGDYVCIASNARGRSYSSVRSLIVSGKKERNKRMTHDFA